MKHSKLQFFLNIVGNLKKRPDWSKEEYLDLKMAFEISYTKKEKKQIDRDIDTDIRYIMETFKGIERIRFSKYTQ